MKILIAAALLLALVVPAHAAKFRESDRKWLPIMDEWAHTYGPCLKRQWEDGEEAEHKSWCKRHDTAEKKLIAHGYCVYANGGVGRPSRDRKHCYVIDEPQPEPVMKNLKQLHGATR
jgi:hypothetical protein